MEKIAEDLASASEETLSEVKDRAKNIVDVTEDRVNKITEDMKSYFTEESS